MNGEELKAECVSEDVFQLTVASLSRDKIKIRIAKFVAIVLTVD